jgi:magnesium-transporting ATPase (P-type)
LKNYLYYFARINAVVVFLFGLIFGLSDSTTKIYNSYPPNDSVDWKHFSTWMFFTYCISSIFYILSEIIKHFTTKYNKESNEDNKTIDDL